MRRCTAACVVMMAVLFTAYFLVPSEPPVPVPMLMPMPATTPGELRTLFKQGSDPEPPERSKVETLMATGDSRLRCLSGVVTVEPGGRLGNQVFEMASAWALARSFDLRVAVPADILASLATVYNNLSVPALEDEVWWGPCTGSITLPFIFSAAEKLVSPFEKFVAWAKENEQPVVLT